MAKGKVMTPIEKEKYKYLHRKAHLIKEEFKGLSKKTLHIQLLGIEILCDLVGIGEGDYQYLLNYYHPFRPQAHIECQKKYHVTYFIFQDERKTLNHPWYSETYPDIQFISEENATYIIERDYFAKGLIDQLSVYGPSPSHDNPDSLDNLFAMLFASCNDQHQAMLLHSAAVVKDDKAFVFFGESGAGKSTLAFHCAQSFGQKVISSDQTLLHFKDDSLVAQSTPITIPELKRDSPLRTWDTYEVAALIHLTQKGEVGLRSMDDLDLLKLFVGQSAFYLTPFSNQQAFLNLCSKIVSLPLIKGELTYEKGGNFWHYFKSLHP